MMKKFVVIDTDIIIDLLRGVPEANDFFRKVHDGQIIAYYSLASEVELFSGDSAGIPEQERIIIDVLDALHLLPFDQESARKSGMVRRVTKTNFADAIIIGCAITSRIPIIVTRNTKHFEIAKEFIKIEKPY